MIDTTLNKALNVAVCQFEKVLYRILVLILPLFSLVINFTRYGTVEDFMY